MKQKVKLLSIIKAFILCLVMAAPALAVQTTIDYTYDGAGKLASLVNFNGTVTTYGYDNANRLTSLENRKSDNAVIATYSFILDGNGNRMQVVRDEPLAPVLNAGTVNSTYTVTGNRLLTNGSSNFNFDNEGQLSDKDGTAYTFDFEHRLTAIGGANPAQYSYDGSGNRLEAIRNGATTRYVYDAAGNLIAEADGLNNIIRYFIHGVGLLAIVNSSNQVYTYHYNAIGNTIALTDGAEAMVNKYVYGPSGKIGNEVEAVSQPFKFVGQYGVMAEPNSLYFMRARYYDPEVGRFISEDPIGFDGGDVNLYAYVKNNPINFVDPLGLYWFRQDWQTPGVIGRPDTPVPPGGLVSEVIEQYVPAGYTFGEMHDSFVGAATNAGLPDWLINIPSMVPAYGVAVATEVLRTVGILDQPVPPAQPFTYK